MRHFRLATAVRDLINENSFELRVEAILILMIFAEMLCHLSSSKRKAWKIQAWTGLEP